MSGDNSYAVETLRSCAAMITRGFRITLSFTKRAGNAVADHLPRLAFSSKECYWIEDMSIQILPSLDSDVLTLSS